MSDNIEQQDANLDKLKGQLLKIGYEKIKVYLMKYRSLVMLISQH